MIRFSLVFALAVQFCAALDSREMDGLRALQQSWVPEWFGWNRSEDPACGWPGVVCDAEAHVVRLQLGGLKIAKSLSIPTPFFPFRRLQALDLHDNRLRGSLSAAWGDLRELRHLDLSQNAYGGVLCSELGVLTALTSLKLANNTFIGVLGSELAQLTALRELDVSNNRLRGTVPAALLARAGSLELTLFPGNVGLDDKRNPAFDRSKAIDYVKDQKVFEEGKCERKERAVANPFV
jgi:hypothetical protein